MRTRRKFFVLLCVLALAGTAVSVSGQAKMLPPGPSFNSTATMPDEGMVKPVSKKAPKPMKIAVLGLENNPFWIPVKQGTMKAAEELAPLGCKVGGEGLQVALIGPQRMGGISLFHAEARRT
jgi:ABC-type sugar transport system substrate-binding protein